MSSLTKTSGSQLWSDYKELGEQIKELEISKRRIQKELVDRFEGRQFLKLADVELELRTITVSEHVVSSYTYQRIFEVKD